MNDRSESPFRGSARCFAAFALAVVASAVASEEAGADGEGPAATVRLTSLSITRAVEFGEEEEPRSRTAMLLGLDLADLRFPLRSIDGIALEEVLTAGGGEDLELLPGQREALRRQRDRLAARIARDQASGESRPGRPATGGRRPARPGGIRLPLTPPSNAFDGLERVRGTVTVTVVTGEQRMITLDPVGDYFDKAVQIREIPTAFVTLRRTADDRIQAFLSRDLAPLFSSIRVRGPEGGSVDARMIGLDRGANKANALYQIELPDDAALDVVYFESTRTLTIPFSFEDVPLPGPEFLPEPDAVIGSTGADE